MIRTILRALFGLFHRQEPNDSSGRVVQFAPITRHALCQTCADERERGIKDRGLQQLHSVTHHYDLRTEDKRHGRDLWAEVDGELCPTHFCCVCGALCWYEVTFLRAKGSCTCSTKVSKEVLWDNGWDPARLLVSLKPYGWGVLFAPPLHPKGGEDE